jgi:long-chain acyl-CoA synthetase
MATAYGDMRWRPRPGNVAYLDIDNAERFGSYERLFFEDRSYTNTEELTHAGRLARVLADQGVSAGDRVVTLLPNSPDLTALFQACWLTGAAIVPVMPQWTPAEIIPVIRSADPAVLVTIAPLAARIQPALAGLGTAPRLLVCGPGDVPGSENLSRYAASAPPVQTPRERDSCDIALLLYTSGTTGPSKGAVLTHGNIYAAVRNAFRFNPDMPRGVMLHILPLAHSFGLLMLGLANAWGFRSILLPHFDPQQVFGAIAQHRVTHMPVVPTMLVYLLNHPARAQYDLSSLRRVTSGGAALPERLRTEFAEVFQCRVDQGYGLSETMATATGYAEEETYRAGSAGRPAPGVRLQIIDGKSQPLPPATVGEIRVAGDHILSGYWQSPADTLDAIDGEWLRTGDIGFLDHDGYLYITDRKKDLIIKGGENVSPREIEEALHLHPAVAAAAVVGIPDAVFGEEICAIVQLKPGATANAEDVQAHVARYVTKFKAPARVEFWPELLRNSTGKISKRDIRDRLAAVSTSG